MSHRRGSKKRTRIGRVSVYLHHGAWWIYYRDDGSPIRRKVAATRESAEQIAAQINAQLATQAPTLLSFQPIAVSELRQQFLDHHEHILKSSLATVRRYRAATHHLERFASQHDRKLMVHAVKPDRFAAYLRSVEIAPNGHPKAARRRLRDKGVQFVLETCRAMYSFAGQRRHLPPYSANPFGILPLDRLKIDDAKPIFVFDSATELAFLKECDSWAFPIHFTLAKTGLRIGELIHLLIEDVDLVNGWLHIRNKPDLGWRIKTGRERIVPLIAEVVLVLMRTIGARKAGPVFVRPRFMGQLPPVVADRQKMATVLGERVRSAGRELSRHETGRLAWSVWRDSGAVKADAIRTSFMRIATAIGHPEATCPKSWRHTFATLLQDGNIDPLVRQITLGHRSTTGVSLGMTARYTHTRPETQREQVERALRLWPESLRLSEGGAL